MTWIVIRSSGFVAYCLLAGATIWGLLVASKILGRAVPAKGLTYVHESLSIGALLATCVHVVALALDDYIEFTPKEIFLPGASDWRPLATAYGGVALYGTLLITASFYVRKRIGQRAWRTLHYATFGIFASALVHGLLAGTDALSPVGVGVYVATTALVIGLVVTRFALPSKQPVSGSLEISRVARDERRVS